MSTCDSDVVLSCSCILCRPGQNIVDIDHWRNSELDAVTGSGATALHSAATVGHADVVALLTAAGADPDVQVSVLGHGP